MKVTVFPWLDIANYGSVLQIFAVQKVLESYADEVEIINYTHNSRVSNALEGSPVRTVNNMMSLFFNKHNFRKVKKHLNFTRKVFVSEDDFNSYDFTADIYCTSSDQIWNMGNDPSVFGARFFSFLPDNARRFAFSSSFGDHSSEDTVIKSKEWIHKFEKISIREASGLRFLNNQYKFDGAVQLVDPTLALPPEFWRAYAPKPKIKGEYIFVYDFMNNRQFYGYARRLSEKTGLPIVQLGHRVGHIFKKGRSVIIPPYFDFISLIDNAKYVLTGSFHATAFAMNLNTTPICSIHNWSPSRLVDFLQLIGAEQCIIKDFDDFDVLNRPVNFEQVNEILTLERERVNEFLRGVFAERG